MKKSATITKDHLRAAKAGNSAAAEHIMDAMQLRLAKEANRISGKFHVEDAISAGRVAVWEAIVENDTTDDRAAFETFALFKARNAMVDFVRSNGSGPTVPERTAGRYDLIMRLVEDDYQAGVDLIESSNDPELGSVEAFTAAHNALGHDVKHFDLVRSNDEGEDEGDANMDLADPEVDVEATALNRVVVEHMLASVTEREAQILCYTYGIGGFPTLKDQEIAELLGISRSRVVNIRKDSLATLAESNTEIGHLA